MDQKDLFNRLWTDYTELNSQAGAVFSMLESRGETVVNDHVAFRTFDLPEVGLEVVAKSFLEAGYVPQKDYDFEVKKLRARHFEHADPGAPKVFISELKTGLFSQELQKIVSGLVSEIGKGETDRWDFSTSGRPWTVSHSVYKTLLEESEYAAWVAAFGFRANHFTVNINQLKGFDGIQELNAFLKDQGVKLNSSGGEIKGSPEVFLEQSSTLAEEVSVQFSDGKFSIPACYYEFAKRYKLPDGTLFQGFVSKSADKIFESTDKQ